MRALAYGENGGENKVLTGPEYDVWKDSDFQRKVLNNIIIHF